jgi:oxaloacetate decarboxylase (Na+ extruding) subunit alpha
VKPALAGADNSSGASAGGFELSEIRRLIRLVQRTGIGELELSSAGRTVRISAQGAVTSPSAVHPTTAPAAAHPASPAPPAAAAEHLASISSPMVGTFYRAPAPDADPYVEVGTLVEVGQTVCIIEAMKLMNEIESEVRGRVASILVENAQPVEFGQKLFLIEPA